MNICFLNMPIEYYSPVSGGAISTIIMQSAQALIARGHQVSVLTITGEGQSYDIGRVVSIDAKQRDDLSFLQRRLSSLRGKRAGYDWPYYEYYRASSMKALQALTPAPDAVFVFNDLVTPQYIRRVLPRTRILSWLQNECRTRQNDLSATLAATEKFLTCSRYIQDWTSRTHNIALDKFEVVLSGVDLEAFHPRAAFMEAPETVRVLCIGRIDPNKGPDIAADAVTQLRAEKLPVSLTVAGGLWFYGHGNEMEDPFFRTLKSKMESAQADYRGHVVRQDVPALVREHDVACVLSRSNEPFGLVTLEAMASGCAVVASNRGGLPEACGDSATLLDPDDFAGVVEALRRLVVDPAFLRSQKEKAVQHAAGASWAGVAEKLEWILEPTDCASSR